MKAFELQNKYRKIEIENQIDVNIDRKLDVTKSSSMLSIDFRLAWILRLKNMR